MAMPGYGVYGPQEEEIEQRRRYADALRQQSMQPLETQMSGRVAVPISWAQGAAKLLQGYAGSKGVEKAGEERKLIAGEKARRTAELLGGMPAARTESTTGAGMTGGLDAQDYPMGAAPGDTRTVQPTMQDRASWLGQLAQVGPEAVSMGGTLIGMQQRQEESAENRAFRQQEGEAARAARAQELQMRLQDQRLSAQERASLQRELAQMQIDARREMTGQTNAIRRDLAAQGGKPPPGYRQTADGNLEAIPGGPADQKIQGALNQDTLGLQGATANFDRLATAANALKNMEGLKGITGLRGAIPNVPGSAAADAQAALNTLKSQVAFGVLQEMRNQSKTGGALGAVSEKELMLLQNNLNALDNAQSYDALKTNLENIVNYTEQAKDRMQKAYNMKHQGRRATDKPAAATGEWSIVR